MTQISGNFWNDIGHKPGYCWLPAKDDISPYIDFVDSDGATLYFHGLNVMPCAPSELNGEDYDGIVSKFVVKLYDENDSEVASYMFNNLKDSLREHDTLAPLTVDNLCDLDITVGLDNRDFRAYTNRLEADINNANDGGPEFRNCHPCKKIRVYIHEGFNLQQLGIGRVVPILTHEDNVGAQTANGGTSSDMGDGTVGSMRRYVKVGNGVDVNQPNSWKLVGHAQKPTEKLYMRDKAGVEFEGLQKWKYARDWFDRFYEGMPTRASVAHINGTFIDNRPMAQEGSNENFETTEWDTSIDVGVFYNNIAVVSQNVDYDQFYKEADDAHENYIYKIIGIVIAVVGAVIAIVVGIFNPVAGFWIGVMFGFLAFMFEMYWGGGHEAFQTLKWWWQHQAMDERRRKSGSKKGSLDAGWFHDRWPHYGHWWW